LDQQGHSGGKFSKWNSAYETGDWSETWTEKDGRVEIVGRSLFFGNGTEAFGTSAAQHLLPWNVVETAAIAMNEPNQSHWSEPPGSDERFFRMQGRLGAARGRSVPAFAKSMIALDLQTFRQSRKGGNVTGVIFLKLHDGAFRRRDGRIFL